MVLYGSHVILKGTLTFMYRKNTLTVEGFGVLWAEGVLGVEDSICRAVLLQENKCLGGRSASLSSLPLLTLLSLSHHTLFFLSSSLTSLSLLGLKEIEECHTGEGKGPGDV